MRVVKRASDGFTLIELMVALVVAGVVGMGILKLFIVQHQAYLRQDAGILATQNARAGFNVMLKEMANAGYDPRGKNVAGVTRWTSDSFGWTADLNADGDVADGGESILYYYAADSSALMRRADGVTSPVTDGVTGLSLSYFKDAAGTVSTSASEIHQVRARMSYQTPRGVPPGRFESQVAIMNQLFK